MMNIDYLTIVLPSVKHYSVTVHLSAIIAHLSIISSVSLNWPLLWWHIYVLTNKPQGISQDGRQQWGLIPSLGVIDKMVEYIPDKMAEYISNYSGAVTELVTHCKHCMLALQSPARGRGWRGRGGYMLPPQVAKDIATTCHSTPSNTLSWMPCFYCARK